jgi:hypothetical protein
MSVHVLAALFAKALHEKWNEDDHPRDEDGRFTDAGDGSSGGGEREHPGEGYSSGAWVDTKGVIHTSNVYDAQRALFENRKVELKQIKQISTLIHVLGETAAKMVERGEAAPVFNLCNVSVEGTNLFCAESKGIPRVEMPVIPAKQTKAFIKHLKSQGYKIEKDTQRADHLRATQNELSGVKVVAAVERIKKEGFYKRLVVSRDDYILDGHHSWAGQLAIDAADNTLKGDKHVKIARVDISIIDLLTEAEKWTGGKGKKPVGERAWDETEHPREPAGGSEGGQFTDSGGGSGSEGEHEAGLKKPEVAGSGSHKDRVKAAVDMIPEKHAEKIKGVRIFAMDKMEYRKDTTGLYEYSSKGRYEPGTITIPRIYPVRISAVKEEMYHNNIERTTVHELGHALDHFHDWKLYDKVRDSFQKELFAIPATRREKINDYYLKNPKETWAELYALTYAKDPKPQSRYFGTFVQSVAQRLFKNTIDKIRTMDI